MDELPSDVYYHVAAYLRTSDAFVVAQVNKRWWAESQRCGWLWQTMRIDSDVQVHWAMTHRYNTRLKRKRNIVYIASLLHSKGQWLLKLALGCLTAPLQLQFDSSCLLSIAATCPRLQSLKLCVSEVKITQRAVNVLMKSCVQLQRVTLPVSAFFGPGKAEDNSLTTVRLYGDLKLARSPELTCFPRITTLKLAEVQNCMSLAVLLCCPLLEHLSLTDCTSLTDDIHPLHLDPALPHVLSLCTRLKTLALIRCYTVICVPHMLDTLVHGGWPALELLSIDRKTVFNIFNFNSRLNVLSCEECKETVVYKESWMHFVRYTRCVRCRALISTLAMVQYF